MMDTSVLTLVDGSDGARRAARFAAQMAGWTAARLVVVAPFQAPYIPRPAMVSSNTTERIWADARSEVMEAAERELDTVREDPYVCVAGDYRILEIEGDLAMEVVGLLFAEHFLAIVLPRAGISGLRPWRLDRISQIVKQSPVPVTLVP